MSTKWEPQAKTYALVLSNLKFSFQGLTQRSTTMCIYSHLPTHSKTLLKTTKYHIHSHIVTARSLYNRPIYLTTFPSNLQLCPRSTQFDHTKHHLGAENHTKYTQLNPKIHKVVLGLAQTFFQKLKITLDSYNGSTKVRNLLSAHSVSSTGHGLYSDTFLL